jgi:flagellar FliL protein
MLALDPDTKPKTDGRRKIESKPIVESKPDEKPKTKSRKVWILIGSLVLVLVAGGLTFLAFPYFRGAKSGSEGMTGAAGKHEQVKATLGLDPFLVNLADENAVRFVKTTFRLGLAEKWNEKEDGSVEIAAIRDTIISLLSSKTAEQIITNKGKNKLREEIRTRVNSISPEIQVLEVYIVDFVVQL